MRVGTVITSFWTKRVDKMFQAKPKQVVYRVDVQNQYGISHTGYPRVTGDVNIVASLHSAWAGKPDVRVVVEHALIEWKSA